MPCAESAISSVCLHRRYLGRSQGFLHFCAATPSSAIARLSLGPAGPILVCYPRIIPRNGDDDANCCAFPNPNIICSSSGTFF